MTPININFDLMKTICLMDIDDFAALPGFETVATQDGLYFFKDNGADILAVAHLDSVQGTKHFHHIDIAGKDYVLNAQLDDRLGAYTILDMLPNLGLKFDILLTEGEEMGRSTAAYFQTTKKYKWMFSFDRHGDDVVMYQYDGKFPRKKLRKAGLKPGNGSFSDIAFLDHLKCIGFNVGCGYEDEHSTWALVDLGVYLDQIRLFCVFYEMFKDLHFHYNGTGRRFYRSSSAADYGMSRGWWGEDDYTQTTGDFYRKHVWSTDLGKYVRRDSQEGRRIENKAPKQPQLPAPHDDNLDKLVRKAIGEQGWIELCAVCQQVPRNDELTVTIGNQIVCDSCVPFAAQCAVCQQVVDETTVIDNVCRECRLDIEADVSGMR